MVCGTAAGPGLPTVVGPAALLFPGGAALARVPGRGRAALGGGVSGGISLPGPAFPFGLPAAFPVGLFLPAPFLPLPACRSSCLRRASSSWRLASRSWRCRRSRSSRWRRASSSCRRRTSAWRWRSSRSACRRWRSSACPGFPLCPELAVSLLRSSRSCSRLTCRSWASWARLACRSWASCWRRSSSSLRCCSRASFSSLAWASSCCRPRPPAGGRRSFPAGAAAVWPAAPPCPLLEPADKSHDNQGQGDQQQQPDIDVSQNGVHTGDKGHKRGEGHVAHRGHVHRGVFLPGVNHGDGAQDIPRFNGGGGHIPVEAKAELQPLRVIGPGDHDLNRPVGRTTTWLASEEKRTGSSCR